MKIFKSIFRGFAAHPPLFADTSGAFRDLQSVSYLSQPSFEDDDIFHE